mmetsp:Transcript_102424/g.288147  ORF Transcript_102424/g.288147 Transcript_102424/m.288147 type:complete len:203 (-) Transcript_102424:37-645(-)
MPRRQRQSRSLSSRTSSASGAGVRHRSTGCTVVACSSSSSIIAASPGRRIRPLTRSGAWTPSYGRWALWRLTVLRPTRGFPTRPLYRAALSRMLWRGAATLVWHGSAAALESVKREGLLWPSGCWASSPRRPGIHRLVWPELARTDYRLLGLLKGGGRRGTLSAWHRPLISPVCIHSVHLAEICTCSIRLALVGGTVEAPRG